MKFHEAVSNDRGNEAVDRNYVPDYAHCDPSWKWTNRPYKKGFVIICAETSVRRLNISDLVLDFTAYTRDFVCP